MAAYLSSHSVTSSMRSASSSRASAFQVSREIYKWPGGYTEVGDEENYARISIERQKAPREAAHGEGNARNIAPGYLFTFNKYPRDDQNKQYLIESAHYRFEENVRRRGSTPEPPNMLDAEY